MRHQRAAGLALQARQRVQHVGAGVAEVGADADVGMVKANGAWSFCGAAGARPAVMSVFMMR
jgi:hypothetical protein